MCLCQPPLPRSWYLSVLCHSNRFWAFHPADGSTQQQQQNIHIHTLARTHAPWLKHEREGGWSLNIPFEGPFSDQKTHSFSSRRHFSIKSGAGTVFTNTQTSSYSNVTEPGWLWWLSQDFGLKASTCPFCLQVPFYGLWNILSYYLSLLFNVSDGLPPRAIHGC